MNAEGDVMGSRYRCRYPGKTLSEYAFVIGFVALASIAALTFMGTSFSDMLMANNINQKGSGLFATLGPKADPTAAPTGDDTTMAALPNEPGAATGDETSGSGATDTVTLTLANGLKLQIPASLTNLENSVETSGANGTTTLLLGRLDALVQQMEQTGNVDPQTLASLKDLSNQGHELAAIQKLLEDKARTAVDQETYLSDTVLYNGGSYTIQTLSLALGLNGWPEDFTADGILEGNYEYREGAIGSQLQRFIETYQALPQNGIMADSAVQETVRSLAVEIAYISETVEHAINTTATNPQDVSAAAASELTHLKSKEICTVDQNTDSGFRCY